MLELGLRLSDMRYDRQLGGYYLTIITLIEAIDTIARSNYDIFNEFR